MTTPQQTLLLDQVLWDLVVDLNGNIAVASLPYALAQDAAGECRLFTGDAYYDQSRGIPYWQQILGHWPPLSLARSYLAKAALLVPGVVASRVYFSSWENRVLSGQVQVTDTNGIISAAAF